MAEYDVIIIGAGLTGLSIGSLLDKAGKKVLILEKNKAVGGRMIGRTHKGHVIDDGDHVPSLAGHLEEIWRRLEIPFPERAFYKGTSILRNGKWSNPLDLVDRKELRKCLSEVASAPMAELERQYDVPLSEWIKARTRDQGVFDWFACIAIMTFAGHDIRNISAGATLVLLREFFDALGGKFGAGSEGGDKGGSYGMIAGGCCSKLIGDMAAEVRRRNIELRLNTTVRNVLVEKGKVKGVEVDAEERLVSTQFLQTGTLRAPTVICTLPIWHLFKAVPKDELPFWYVEWIERMQFKVGTWWAIHQGLDSWIDGWDEEVARNVLAGDHPRGMFLVSSNIPGYAPAGEYQMCHFFSKDRNLVPNLFEIDQAHVWRQHKQYFKDCEEDLRSLYPTLEKKVLWSMYHVGAYTVAEEPGISVLGRPYGLSTGVEGLYLSSDTLREGRGTGMQAAANAALKCVDQILGRS